MDQHVCRQCGAELVPETNFCRKCGAAIPTSGAPIDQEKTTTLFEGAETAATQRFDPRPTAPEPGFGSPAKKPGLNRLILSGVILLIVLAGIVSTVAVVKIRNRSHVASVDSLLYPGSTKTMDIAAGGGRAVSLETSDSFEKVSRWYQATIKPEKTVQLTDRSVVMKGDTATVTIIGDDIKTKVLLKIIP